MEPRGSTQTHLDRALRPTVEVGGREAPERREDAGLGADRGRAIEASSGTRDDDDADADAEDLSVPERLGRFLVLRRLGTGGMGTVLEAYDETLDRKVAVKRLHRDASGEAGQHHRQRLLREAQALARLSHPNVVQVYDAGEHDQRLYIAMELVEGQTLWEWQKTPRPWPEVVRAYMGAGAGLSAAHAQGIVHRDFKPTNCIIDPQGRVKVLDFGLARGVDDMIEEPEVAVRTLDPRELAGRFEQTRDVPASPDEPTRVLPEDERGSDSFVTRAREGSSGRGGSSEEPASTPAIATGSRAASSVRVDASEEPASTPAIATGSRAASSRPRLVRASEPSASTGSRLPRSSDASNPVLSVLSLQLTRTGAMLGTPAYMAPEQASGRPADARSDQFSFCVALYEAIYGERPFPGNTGLAVLADKPLRLPAKARAGMPAVPQWLRKLLARGMALDKERRFAGMDELLGALQRGTRRGRRIGAIALGVGVLAAGTAAATMRTVPCEGLREAEMPGWSEAERGATEAALRATKVAHAWEATAAGLDAYARGWVDARAQACEATHVQRVAGEELLELRMACLDRRAVQLRATVELFAQADAGVAARSAQVVRSLPPVEPCLDAERLREGPGPLPDALAAPAAEIRAQVARSWAFDAAGRAAQGLEAAEQAVAEAERLGPEAEPLHAEALHNRGRLYRAARRLDDARRDLEAVLQSAEHGGDETLALDALQELLLVAHDAADRSAFGAWRAVAHGKLRRLEDEPRARARLLHVEGLAALREGEPARAVEALQGAEAQWRELGPGAALELARTLVQLGVARGKQGDEARAEEAFAAAQALAEREGLLPLLAETHQERGRLHLDRGRLVAAETELRRALELRVSIDGPTAPITIPTRVPLAMLLQQRGELPAAIAMAQAAKQSLGPGVPAGSHAQVMSLLARFHRQEGDWNAALEDYQRVEEALAASPSPDPIEQAMLHSNVADCLRMMGRLDAARTRYERALEGLRVHAAAGDQRHVYPLSGLGILLAAQGDRQGAAAVLRRALAIHEAAPKDLDMGAMLRWELGRAVLDDARSGTTERREARELVRAAQDQFRAFGDAPMAAEIDAFLVRCGSRCGEPTDSPP